VRRRYRGRCLTVPPYIGSSMPGPWRVVSGHPAIDSAEAERILLRYATVVTGVRPLGPGGVSH